jgi:hypothetical protein
MRRPRLATAANALNSTSTNTPKLPLGRLEGKGEVDPDVSRFTSALALFFRKLREEARHE